MDHFTRTIQADFDHIARLSAKGFDHNAHYHDFLLKQLPASCQEALEVGCGTGAFSRLLAERSARVLAIDLSPQMIRVAEENSQQHRQIAFQITDVMQTELPAERFDCVVAIATLHHLPMREVLLKMRGALKPSGTLVILDLYRPAGLSDLFLSALAMPVSLILRWLKTGRLRAHRVVRKVWAEHARHDVFLTLSEVRQICDEILPAARLRRHLLWRYSVVWQKPSAKVSLETL